MQKTPLPAHFNQGLPEKLTSVGFSDAAAAQLLAFDHAMFAWHRMTLKGELPLRLIAELGLEIELSHFSAMTAILRIESGVGHCMAQPATVGLLAEELGVDPSRASRTAADLIDKGYLVRTADQTDGRKIVLQQTELAKSTFRAIVDRKWQKMIGVFQDWSEADIAAFSTLFQRYSAEIRKVYSENG
ncbi:MAG: hypothetical protein RIR95_789 [Pseudomonadota bacterium]